MTFRTSTKIDQLTAEELTAIELEWLDGLKRSEASAIDFYVRSWCEKPSNPANRPTYCRELLKIAKSKLSDEQFAKLRQKLLNAVPTPEFKQLLYEPINPIQIERPAEVPEPVQVVKPARPAEAVQIERMVVDVSTLFKEISPAAENALLLVDTGFDVMPLPFAQKQHGNPEKGIPGYRWKRHLRYSLIREDIPHIFAGRCNIGVLVKDGLFVLDCDSIDSFHHHITEMRRRSIPVYGWYTGRGAHILFYADRSKVKSIPAGVMSETEVKGDGTYIVGPGSLHPTLGVVYQWFDFNADKPPRIDPAAIDWLTDKHGNPITLQVARGSKRGKVAHDYIRSGASIPEGTRNNSLFDAARDARDTGYSQEQAQLHLMPPAVASGQTEREARATIRSAYSRQPTKTGKRHERETQLLMFAASYNWKAHGRTADTDRRVFLALVACWTEEPPSSRRGFFASQRDIATKARLARESVRKSLARLRGDSTIQQALVQRVYGDPAKVEPDRYQFTPHVWEWSDANKEGSKLCETSPLERSSKQCYVMDYFHTMDDTSERGALGVTGNLIYRAILSSQTPPSVREIALQTDLTRDQVNYQLKPENWLISANLVERLPGRPARYVAHAVTDEQMRQRIVIPSGAPERAKRRKDRHNRERAVFVTKQLIEWREKFDPEYPGYRGGERLPAQPRLLLEEKPPTDTSALIERARQELGAKLRHELSESEVKRYGLSTEETAQRPDGG